MARFEWQTVETQYRDTRHAHGADELRWILNRETILDTTTGATITRSAIRHPGICVMVPFLDSAHILLIRQFRYAAGQELWELPAGTMKGRLDHNRVLPAETPEACAQRELIEETGYAASTFLKVCECYAMPGSSDEFMHVFLAHNLTRRTQSLDLGEAIEEVRPFSLEEISALLSRAEIHDAKTLVGLFYALLHVPEKS